LQLDQSNRQQSINETVRKIYRQGGILGFYKGISASYMGISETVIHFVIYEAVKKRLHQWSTSNQTLADQERHAGEKTTKDFVQFMAAGAISKTVASVIAYPHGKHFLSWVYFWALLALMKMAFNMIDVQCSGNFQYNVPNYLFRFFWSWRLQLW